MKQNRLFTKGAFLALFLSLFSLTALFGQTLTITTTVCSPANEVRLTGPWWGWNPTGGPVAVSNGDGTWTFTFNPAPTADMEYLLVVDGVQENLIQAMVNGGSCAPITDYSSYANRQWLMTDGLTITNTYGQCGSCGGSTLTQMDLPVTFEGSTIEYGVIGFEGAQASTIEVDPTNANNTVVKVIKSASAQPWAGTTITAAAELGLATPIPFSATNKSMKLRVWSPDAGITVRLKVEEHGDPTHSVETDAVTTVAGQWETLTFNFANQGAGTAAINLAYAYDKPSVFFNYGVNGATAGEKTYYFDDLEFVSTPPAPVTVTYQVDVTEYLAGGATLNPNGIRVGGNFTTVGASLPDWSPANAACAMTDLGNNLWSIAVTYPASAIGTTQLYKFVNGDWGTNEGGGSSLIAINGCGVNDGGGNINRTLVIPATNTTYTYCWDKCVACGVVTLAQMNLPVTFEGTTTDYGVIGFEGAEASTIEVDPTNANNTVVKVI